MSVLDKYEEVKPSVLDGYEPVTPARKVPDTITSGLPQEDELGFLSPDIPGRVAAGAKTVGGAIKSSLDRGSTGLNKIISSVTGSGGYYDVGKDEYIRPEKFGDDFAGQLVPKGRGVQAVEGVFETVTGGLEGFISLAYSPLIGGIGAFTPELKKAVEGYKEAFDLTASDETKKAFTELGPQIKELWEKADPTGRDLISNGSRLILDAFITKGAKATVEAEVRAAKKAAGFVLDKTSKAAEKVVAAAKSVPGKIKGVEQRVVKALTPVNKQKAIAQVTTDLKKLGFTDAKQTKFIARHGQSPAEWMVNRGLYDPNPKIQLKNMQSFFKEQMALKEQALTLAGKNPRLTVINDSTFNSALTDLWKIKSKLGRIGKNRDIMSQIKNWQNKSKTTGLTFRDKEEIKRMYERTFNFGYDKTAPGSISQQRIDLVDTSMRESQELAAKATGFNNLPAVNKEIQASVEVMKGVYKSTIPGIEEALLKAGLDWTDFIMMSHMSPASFGLVYIKHRYASLRGMITKAQAGGATTGVVQPDLSAINLKARAGLVSQRAALADDIKAAVSKSTSELIKSKDFAKQTDMLDLIKEVEKEIGRQLTLDEAMAINIPLVPPANPFNPIAPPL